MAEPIVEVVELAKAFPTHGGSSFLAVDGVSFKVARGDSLAVVGESGSGKTTLARMLVGLETPTSGVLNVAGASHPKRRSTSIRRQWARRIQLVFQDCYSSLNPRQSPEAAVMEVLSTHFDLDRSAQREKASQILATVGLHDRAARALPRNLSGGQRQRAAIARALAAEPEVLVLDEAVAALDVSIQAQVLNLITDLRETTDITYIFVTHDLAVVRQVCTQAIVMREGKVVERGTTSQVLDHPQHPYTQLLLDAVPRRGWRPPDIRDIQPIDAQDDC